MKSCGRPPLTRACTTILSATSLKGSVWSVAQILRVDLDRRASPNDSRNSTCARDHAAFSLRSLFGSRLM